MKRSDYTMYVSFDQRKTVLMAPFSLRRQEGQVVLSWLDGYIASPPAADGTSSSHGSSGSDMREPTEWIVECGVGEMGSMQCNTPLGELGIARVEEVGNE